MPKRSCGESCPDVFGATMSAVFKSTRRSDSGEPDRPTKLELVLNGGSSGHADACFGFISASDSAATQHAMAMHCSGPSGSL